MPMRSQTQSRLSARAVYARNAMKVEAPKRGRPRKVSKPSERILSENPKNSKTVVGKRQRSVGKKRNVERVENNSSEADCSSEGEEMDYTDDESKVADAGSDGGDEDASSELEENSAEEEEDSADEAEDSADEAEDSAEDEEDSVENSEDEDLVDEEENLNEEEEDCDDEEEIADDDEEVSGEEEMADDDEEVSDEEEMDDEEVSGEEEIADDEEVSGEEEIADDEEVSGEEEIADDEEVSGEEEIADDEEVSDEEEIADDEEADDEEVDDEEADDEEADDEEADEEEADEEEADEEEADEDEVRYSLPDPKKISPARKKKVNVIDSTKNERQKTTIKKKNDDDNLVSKRASPDKKKKGEITTKNESPNHKRPKTDNKNKSEKPDLQNLAHSGKQKKEKTRTPDKSEAAEHEKQRADSRNEDENENLSLQNHVISDEQQNPRIKTSNKSDETHTNAKRKIKSEASDEDEDMTQQNGFIPNKQKKIRKESQSEENLSQENNISSVAPFQRLLNQTAANSNSNATGGRRKKRSTTFNSSLGPPLSLNKFYESVPCGNVAADEAFRYLIHPTTPEDFFKKEFEMSPFHVMRYRPCYYKELFSNEDLNTMLKENNLQYGVHIDVLKYVNGQRVPVEAVGKAYYSNVWEDYKEGFSIRVRNPQAYNKNVWNLCALLQEYFSSSVGVNVYLTPPNAQGFPPHYDDIDAFILQIEGTKHWKVYAPRNTSEDLARYSSIDFKENEIGPVLMEITLNPGDLLYIPRGYIHQACTNDHYHSLHLTFSTNQLNTWGDLLLSATRKAVEKAILNDVHFRKAVPRNFMNYAGVTVSEGSSKQHSFVERLNKLAAKAMEYLDPNEVTDTHALRFIRCSLPPTFNKIEQERSIHGNGSCWKNGAVRLKSPIELDTEVRLIRKRNQRLVIDESGPKLFHNLENTRDPKDLEEEGEPGVYIDFDMEGVPAFTYLLQKHPTFVKVIDLPISDTEDKISFATSLYENGLLMTKYPVPTVEHGYDWIKIPDEAVIKIEKDD